MKIYLSGTNYDVFPYKFTSHRNWKKKFKSYFSYFDSPIFFEPQFTDKPGNEIVKRDKQDIIRSDILVAYIAKKTCGTSMEILFAYYKHVKVYVIDPKNIVSDDPWVKSHSDGIFRTVKETAEHIIRNEKRKRN